MTARANERLGGLVKMFWPKEWMAGRERVRYVGGKGDEED
jgi:hypothetical protein